MTTLRYCRFVLAVCALAILLPRLAAADKIDIFVNRVVQDEQLPGVAVLVVRKGKIEKLQGYGYANLEHRVPVTADTIFQSGSVGKLFTAAAVLRLVEQGKLGLDDPLAMHFDSAPAAWQDITVRHLLNHTAGLKDYGDEFDYRRDYTEAEQLDVAMSLPIEFEPGTQWSYSNSGYMVLGILVSEIAGIHWGDYLDAEIFTPAGMDTARVISESDIVANRAAGYERSEDGELRNQEWVAPSFNRQADGALYFSARDLAAFARALRSRALLGDSAYTAWWTPADLGNGITYPYGFGWDITDQRGRRVVAHGGAWQGFRAFIAVYLDDDLTVAVLANADDAEPGPIARGVASLVDSDVSLPSVASLVPDPDPERTRTLLGVLEAWAESTVVEAMGHGLANTRSNSERESYSRERVADRLERMSAFRFLDEDDVSEMNMSRRGGSVARIVYYSLDTDEEFVRYRFYIAPDGRVLHFGTI